jgi:hypothetical protein
VLSEEVLVGHSCIETAAELTWRVSVTSLATNSGPWVGHEDG